MKKILDFIKYHAPNGAVLGVSGGIDSAVVATLCVRALGKSKVHALLMPERGVTMKLDFQDALTLCKTLGITYHVLPVNGAVKSLSYNNFGKKTLGNLKARVRMVMLYAYANEHGLRVAGTGNKSELMLGYFTKYGDGASDFLPIGHLYKSEVYALAKGLKLNDTFLQKAPSAGLWRNQTDQLELGLSYEHIDKVLSGRIKNPSVLKMVKDTEHKRSLPPVP